jgi:hypothetical protein
MPQPNHEARAGDSALRYTDGNLHGAVTGVLGAFFTILMQVKGMAPGGPLVPFAGFAIAFFIGRGIARALFGAGAAMVTSVFTPSGDTTKYTPTYSHIEALEVKGDLEGAAAAWDAAVAENPGHALTLVRAGDFHLRLRNDPAAALLRYQQVRALGSGGADAQRYVQQKIVDLYLGPLQDDGRAMVELRRLIDAFPGTREADGARAALAELKARRTSS